MLTGPSSGADGFVVTGTPTLAHAAATALSSAAEARAWADVAGTKLSRT